MPKTRDQWIRERTEAEMARGKAVLEIREMSEAQFVISREFNPDHINIDRSYDDEPGYRISPKEQAHREEYRRINRRLRGDPDA